MSVEKGFASGFGGVLGVVAGIVVLIIVLRMGNKVVEPCPSCHGTGNCVLCGGSGKGMIFGDCMNCDGKKRCPACGGVGWKKK